MASAKQILADVIDELRHDSSAPADERRKDAQAHAAIWDKIMKLDPNDPEFEKLWTEAERIKNKYKGFVPTMESQEYPYSNLSYSEMLDILHSEDAEERDNLALYPKALPHDILLALAQDEDSDVRRFAAQRDQKLPLDVLEVLVQDSNQLVLTGLANNTQTLPASILLKLAKLRNFGVDSSLMDRKGLPIEAIKILANSSNVYVKQWALAKLNTKGMRVKRGVYYESTLSYVEMLNLLASESDGDKIALMVKETPLEILKVLALDGSQHIKMCLGARCDEFPPEIARILVKDPDPAIRWHLPLYTRHLPKDVLDALANDENARVRQNRMTYWGRYPQYESISKRRYLELLDIIHDDSNPANNLHDRRSISAHERDLPADIVNVLAHDDDDLVAFNVLTRTNTRKKLSDASLDYLEKKYVDLDEDPLNEWYKLITVERARRARANWKKDLPA